MKSLEKVAYEKARGVLEGCTHELGMKAALASDYQQVWCRDSMISFLGASLLHEEKFDLCFRRTLETLSHYQSELGLIPNNVDVATRKSGQENAGHVDSNLWYLLGHFCYYHYFQDCDFLRAHAASIEKAVLWLRYQDSNECGLLEVHEASDWADLLAHRFNVLYDNVLYYAALKAAAKLLSLCERESGRLKEMAQDVKDKINVIMWAEELGDYKGLEKARRMHFDWYWIYQKMAEEIRSVSWFYRPYITFREYGTHFDTFGNLLAVIFGVADQVDPYWGRPRSDVTLDYIEAVGVNRPYPARSLYPPIRPGDRDWREYYKNYSMNYPHQYINGGSWPFLGGFYIAALITRGRHQKAEEELEKLAEVNRKGLKGEWEFNEWYHGETGNPMGKEGQAWSAAMYIYAYEAVREKKVPVLGLL